MVTTPIIVQIGTYSNSDGVVGTEFKLLDQESSKIPLRYIWLFVCKTC